jgi:hypothetical protein
MNGRLLELALKKQHLQYQSGALRNHCAAQVRGLQPVFEVVDGVNRGTVWLRRYPYLTVAVGVALLVARPKAAWRWTRRGLFAWQFWRHGAGWLSTHQPTGGGWLTRLGRHT